ncbi:MAG: toll/interleukin-1 receptor domain-containing protein, partial [Rubrivivax sp.]
MALFISYRRDDAAGYARAVHDALVQRFGAGQVFMDVVDIGGGQRFDAVIRRSLAASQVLLVLIGPRWQGGGEPPRLHDPADFVHQEIAAALAQRLMVMPLLLDGTPMPAEATLPPPLQALARCNALALDNSRFNADIERLAATLAPLLRAQPRRGWLLGGGATLLL